MIQPGLERIGRLLQNVQFPWKAVHVAGTNGKGSICGTTSNLLTRRTIRNGRFTSPHIVNRWDCITINNKVVPEQKFRRVEDYFVELNERENINASEFELLTATAFQLFNEEKVDVGIIEVGMGGKLDATNILNNQAVSIISKIARDHEAFLGHTLEEIALHKAGVLRPNVPYIVNPMNDPGVLETIEEYAKEIGAGPRILPDSEELKQDLFKTKHWRKFAQGKLPFQRDNAILAFLAYREVMRSLGLWLETRSIHAAKLLSALRNTQPLPGRQQTVSVPLVFGRKRRPVVIDGAHNTDAAAALLSYVEREIQRTAWGKREDEPRDRKRAVTWVLAMTEGKEPRGFLRTLLRPGDNVVATSFGPVDGMPWVKPMHPDTLLSAAKETCPDITGVAIPKRGAYRALCAAKYLPPSPHIVLTGSLYLVGDFFREHEVGKKAIAGEDEFPNIGSIDREEKCRVEEALNEARARTEGGNDMNNIHVSGRRISTESDVPRDSKEARILRKEIAQLEKEMQSLNMDPSAISSTESESESSGEKLFFRRTPVDTPKSAPYSPPTKEKSFDDLEKTAMKIEQGRPSVTGQTANHDATTYRLLSNPKTYRKKKNIYRVRARRKQFKFDLSASEEDEQSSQPPIRKQ